MKKWGQGQYFNGEQNLIDDDGNQPEGMSSESENDEILE